MREKIFVFVMLLTTTLVNAQKITQKGDVNTSNYPHLEFIVNVYDPEIKKQNDFSLKENNTPVAISVEHMGQEVEDSSKMILILFEDMTHYTHIGERASFRAILNNSLPEFVKKGDRVNIAVFDRNRDGTTPLRFLLNNYTDDTTLLIQSIDRSCLKLAQ